MSTLTEKDNTIINNIIKYWYPIATWDRDTQQVPQEMNKLWFGGGEKMDSEINEQFGQLFEGLDQLKNWLVDHNGRLAYVLLTDQFSRNVFRKQAKAFQFDSLALNVTRQILENKDQFNAYKNYEKQFLVMPLMHSENINDQNLCVKVFTELIQNAIDRKLNNVAKGFEFNLKYANDHMEIIKQFGRFPHRNEVLNRQSTPEEQEYLKSGHTWGQ